MKKVFIIILALAFMAVFTAFKHNIIVLIRTFKIRAKTFVNELVSTNRHATARGAKRSFFPEPILFLNIALLFN